MPRERSPRTVACLLSQSEASQSVSGLSVSVCLSVCLCVCLSLIFPDREGFPIGLRGRSVRHGASVLLLGRSSAWHLASVGHG